MPKLKLSPQVFHAHHQQDVILMKNFGFAFDLSLCFYEVLFVLEIKKQELVEEHIFTSTYLHFKSCSIVLGHDQKSFQLSRTIALIIVTVCYFKVKCNY